MTFPVIPMIANMVGQVSASTGTGDIALAGVIAGNRSFFDAQNAGQLSDNPFYRISSPDTFQFEWGVAAISDDGSTLSRVTVLGNSDGNTNKINFAGKILYVINGLPAANSFYVDQIGVPSIPIFGAVTFDTIALARLAVVPSVCSNVFVAGYHINGIGGANYVRVSGDPGTVGKLQDASGAWFEIKEPQPQPAMFGAYGDAVQDQTTGGWSYPGNRSDDADTAAILAWELNCQAQGILSRSWGIGNFIVTATVINSLNISNIDIFGVSRGLTKIIPKITAPASTGIYTFQGVIDPANSVAVYLTAAAAAGDRIITVNDTSQCAVDQYVVLQGNSQAVYDNDVVGGAHWISSTSFYVDGDQTGQNLKAPTSTFQGALAQVYGVASGYVQGRVVSSSYDGNTDTTTAVMAWYNGGALINENLCWFSQTAFLGEVVQVLAITDETTLTLHNQIQFSYVADTGIPARSTAVRRYITPCTDISIHDLSIEWDPTFTYGGSATQLAFKACIGIYIDRLTFNNLRNRATDFVQSLQWNIDNCYYLNGDGAIYANAIDYGTATGKLTNSYGNGMRHFITTSTPRFAGIEQADAIISDCIVEGANTTAYDVHTGARNFNFYNCIARGGGLSTTGDFLASGFNLRGRYCQVDGFEVVACNFAVASTFGNYNTIRNGTTRSCVTAIKINTTGYLTVSNIAVFGNLGSVITVDNKIFTAMPGVPSINMTNVMVYGNPPAVIESLSGAAPDWSFGVTAPQATNFFAGPPNIPWSQVKPGAFNVLTLGYSGFIAGQVVMSNATNTNTVTLLSGVTSASYVMTLPTAVGTVGQFLTTSSTGVLSWSSTLPTLSAPVRVNATATTMVAFQPVLASSLTPANWTPLLFNCADNNGTENFIEWVFSSIAQGIGPAISGHRNSSTTSDLILYATTSGARAEFARLIGANSQFKLTAQLLLPGGTLLATSAALTSNAGAGTATLLNSPVVGNPTKWVPINDNGTTRYIPAW